MQEPVLYSKDQERLYTEAVDLLSDLIATKSYSREEEHTASLLEQFLLRKGFKAERYLNNVWVKSNHFKDDKPVLLLNSHHDTVKPNAGYTLDPFHPLIKEGRLYGLGSNDAGGALVALLMAFLYFANDPDLPFNLVYIASAEEEISGSNGIEAVLPKVGKIDFGIVGEPTQMQMAVAEKGLLVMDALCYGKSGHAAREEGDSALYKAIQDIQWIKNYHFQNTSALLGPVKMSVTVVETPNKAHNVIPAECRYVIDVRVNDCYTHEQIIETLQPHLLAELKPRSLRMRSSSIALDHPLVKSGLEAGRWCYGSPTTSDKALMPFPALKMGPGDSARSHTADEYIYLEEIREGIELYIKLLQGLII